MLTLFPSLVIVAGMFAAIALLFRFHRLGQSRVAALSIPPRPRKPFDWFLWESEQIQHGGYAPWFDHWRYEGEPGAYLDPTPEQRAKVFQASLARARERYGEERLADLIELAVSRLAETGLTREAAYERVRFMGQDPVRFAIDIAEGRRDPNMILATWKGQR